MGYKYENTNCIPFLIQKPSLICRNTPRAGKGEKKLIYFSGNLTMNLHLFENH